MTTPQKLQRIPRTAGQALEITWDDGEVTVVSVAELQDQCPCANCGEKKLAPPADSMMLPILNPEEIQPLEIVTMQPAGNYAYTIQFSHGCNQGIYSFADLRRISMAAGEKGTSPK